MTWTLPGTKREGGWYSCVVGHLQFWPEKTGSPEFGQNQDDWSRVIPKTETGNEAGNQSADTNGPGKPFGDVPRFVKADLGTHWQVDFSGNKVGLEERRVEVVACAEPDRKFPGQKDSEVFRPPL